MASVWVLIASVGGVGALYAQGSENETVTDSGFDDLGGGIIGFVQPSKQVLVSTPLAGILKSVVVEEGVVVITGQPLAQMDDGIQAAQLEISRLEFKQQQVMLDEAELKYQKALALQRDEVASDWEVREAKVARDGAQIALEFVNTKVKRDQVMLDRYRLLAPFGGQVIRVVAEEGETVDQGEDILLLVSMEKLEAHISVPMDLYGKLKIGKEYQLVADLPDGVEGLGEDKVLMGRLKFHEPNINFASRTFHSIFTIENPKEKLPFGFRVRLIRPD